MSALSYTAQRVPPMLRRALCHQHRAVTAPPASDTAAVVPLPPWRSLGHVLQDAAAGFFNHQAQTLGAAIAYYTLFSLAPVLLVAIAVAGAAFGEEAARGEIFRQLAGLIGAGGAAAVQELLASVQRHGQSGWGAALGVVLLLIGATTVFAELQAALDAVWRDTRLAARRGPPPPWRSLLRARLLAFGVILGIGFLLVVSLLVSAALSALGGWWQVRLHGWQLAASLLHGLVSTGLSVALFAMLFRFLPSVRVPWRHVWLGALVTAGLFALGRWAIGWYIGTAAVDSGFGAAGSLVAVLVWVYGSAQVFLFGAELTRAVAVHEGVA
jgi:membrane protein